MSAIPTAFKNFPKFCIIEFSPRETEAFESD